MLWQAPSPQRSRKPLQIRNPSFSACSSSSATVVLSYLKLLALLLFFRYGYLCLCYASLLLHLLPSSSFLLLHLRRQGSANWHPGPSSTFFCSFFPLFCSVFFSVHPLCFLCRACFSLFLLFFFDRLLSCPSFLFPLFIQFIFSN